LPIYIYWNIYCLYEKDNNSILLLFHIFGSKVLTLLIIIQGTTDIYYYISLFDLRLHISLL